MSSVGSGDLISWQSSLLQSAARGDEARVRELIQEGILYGDRFRSALRIALQKVAGRGHEPLTRLLVENGAEVNAAQESEVTALFRAAELGKDTVVRVLLDYGAQTETTDKFKRTPIFAAAQRNHRNTLNLLLQAGADVNAKDSDGQSLMLCLASERPEKPGKWSCEIIQLLLDTNLDLEAKDKDGRTALLWASATGKEELARLLLMGRSHNNADIENTNNRGKTALHLAAENNRLGMAKLLLDFGAKAHARSDGGWTALHNAAEKGHTGVASLLIEKCADINAKTSSGMTPLHWCARNGHVGVVELLLVQEDIRRSVKDSFDSTPMLGAAQNGHVEIVKLLSPADDGTFLSNAARGACKGFQATVADFGMENRPMNHNKHSVFDLLYGWDEKRQKPLVTTLVKNISAKPTFRWIHLPTNNLSWVEALITKSFVEDNASDVEGFKALERSFGQLHRGPTVHSNFMRPSCQRIAPTAKDPTYPDLSERITEKTVNAAEKLSATAPESKANVGLGDDISDENPRRPGGSEKRGTKPDKASRNAPNGVISKKASVHPQKEPTPSKKGEKRRPEKRQAPTAKVSKSAERNGNIVLFMPYLHYETHRKREKMTRAIKQATTVPVPDCEPNAGCDEMLIRAYLQSTQNLQIRRTLDQFYYHGISTEDRDTDQVVYRYTRDKGKQIKVFMVDQLWLWILGNELIVTSFPQRWDQPKNDPLNVLDGIIEDINSKTRPPMRSVYDLALLITGRCSGVFDRHRLGDEDYQFLDMFESSIGEVVCH